MCGIFAIFNSTLEETALRHKLIACSQRIRHRGPDWSGYVLRGLKNEHGIAHERLAIIDPDSGSQPLVSPDGKVTVAANGELYNYKELFDSEDISTLNYIPKTGSDCEVIIPLYLKYGKGLANYLRGMFSFVLYDEKTDSFIAVRDHIGIIPLYIGYGADGSVWFASEMKAFSDECCRIETFPPGHLYDSSTNAFIAWYTPRFYTPKWLPSHSVDLVKIRESFTKAVKRRMMSDVPWGVLLSGGLDSSIVASVAMKLVKENPDTEYSRLHSFSVGIEGSPDLIAAKKVSDFLGTKHHNLVYTIQEGIDALREVIYHLETYDVTTIRASTPMFLMSRKIKARGTKMVLSGEGADEIFGGYLYFHKAPNRKEFHEELVDKLKLLHKFDCLRANKATCAWGVEVRVPFLDRDFLDLIMETDAEEKMIKKELGRMEKYIFRKAFDTPEDPYLPEEVLWRQKEQFSDGVGYGWIDALRDNAEIHVTDQQLRSAAHRFPINTPITKEGYYYRSIFEEFFPNPSCALTVVGGPSIACSTPRALEWDVSFQNRADPSGRAVGSVHDAAYNEDYTLTGKKPIKQDVMNKVTPQVVVSGTNNKSTSSSDASQISETKTMPHHL